MAYEDYFRRVASTAAKEARYWADAAECLGSDVKPNKAVACWQAATAALQTCAAAYQAMAARRDHKRRMKDAGKFVAGAFEAELAKVAAAPAGRRTDQLNRSAYALYRFVASGDLPGDLVLDGLTAAARHCGLDRREAQSTIDRAAKARGCTVAGNSEGGR